MNDKIWRDIPWYKGKYQIDLESWMVKSLNFWWTWKEWILKAHLSMYWYPSLSLNKNWKKRYYWIHQLVMLVVKWKPKKWMEICHNDWVKTNNHPSNLRYDTCSENQKDKFRHWFRSFFQTNHPMLWKNWSQNHKSKAVSQFSMDWTYIRDWESMNLASIHLWISSHGIWLCCRWKIKSSWWYVWKYK